jgi:hypothetical protein
VDRKLRCCDNRRQLRTDTEGETITSPASGATFEPRGFFHFGTAPLSRYQYKNVPKVTCPCTVACLLDADAGAMTVFVDGKPLKQQCEYTFPTDHEWFPSVGLQYKDDALFSNSV